MINTHLLAELGRGDWIQKHARIMHICVYVSYICVFLKYANPPNRTPPRIHNQGYTMTPPHSEHFSCGLPVESGGASHRNGECTGRAEGERQAEMVL